MICKLYYLDSLKKRCRRNNTTRQLTTLCDTSKVNINNTLSRKCYFRSSSWSHFGISFFLIYIDDLLDQFLTLSITCSLFVDYAKGNSLISCMDITLETQVSHSYTYNINFIRILFRAFHTNSYQYLIYYHLYGILLMIVLNANLQKNISQYINLLFYHCNLDLDLKLNYILQFPLIPQTTCRS